MVSVVCAVRMNAWQCMKNTVRMCGVHAFSKMFKMGCRCCCCDRCHSPCGSACGVLSATPAMPALLAECLPLPEVQQ